MTRLASILFFVFELHCMAGLRDQHFSSVGRSPFVIRIADKQDEDCNNGQCIVMGTYKDRGIERDDFFILSKEDFDRVQPGKSYSLVKARAIRHADPFTIHCTKARYD